MNLARVMLVAIGLIPDANQIPNLHPATEGGFPNLPRISFCGSGAFELTMKRLESERVFSYEEFPHQKNLENITGRKYGRWTVVGIVKREKDRVHWAVICDCGNLGTLPRSVLRSGDSQSCGCYHAEVIQTCNTTHGCNSAEGQTPEYRSWQSMVQRCNNQKNPRWQDYGGRGITICERWNIFENFLADMGTRPSLKHSLNRINNDRGYCPENCEWATQKVQMNNTRRCQVLEFNGLRMNITQWAEKLGIKRSTIYNRLFEGWTVERALGYPVQPNNEQRKQANVLGKSHTC